MSLFGPTPLQAVVPADTLIDAAEQVMEEAYNKASNNGKYPALARQIMYAARPAILSLVDDPARSCS